MKITKEILEHFKLNSMTLKSKGQDLLCFLERVEKDEWTLSIAQNSTVAAGQKISLQIAFDDNEAAVLVTADVIEAGDDWLAVKLDSDSPEGNAQKFIISLSEMERKYESFGRRKEERVKIGKEKAKSFGLASVEQTIFFPASRTEQPCVVLDASVHGVCVITPKTPSTGKEENFCVKISFEKPAQTIVLRAHKVYSKITKTERASFATLSCQLLEPVHFVWKERVIALISSS